MKRFLIWTLVTLVAALTGGFAIADRAHAADLMLVGASELNDVTGGVCFINCGDDEDEEEEEEAPPRVVGTDWRPISQSSGPAEQLSYAIYTEISNVYGSSPLEYSVTVNDQCRFRWVSGGIGIAKGFNIAVGRTYDCDVTSTLKGKISPGYRVKVYKGDMRQYTTVTVAEYLLLSDGSERESGERDVGRRERRWNRFTPVHAYGY